MFKKILIACCILLVSFGNVTFAESSKPVKDSVLTRGAYISVNKTFHTPEKSDGEIYITGHYERVNNVATNIDISVSSNLSSNIEDLEVRAFPNGSGIRIDIYYRLNNSYCQHTVYA